MDLSHWVEWRCKVSLLKELGKNWSSTTHNKEKHCYQPQNINYRQGDSGFILRFRALSSLLSPQMLTCPPAYNPLESQTDFCSLRYHILIPKTPQKKERTKGIYSLRPSLFRKNKFQALPRSPRKRSYRDWNTEFLARRNGVIMTILD